MKRKDGPKHAGCTGAEYYEFVGSRRGLREAEYWREQRLRPDQQAAFDFISGLDGTILSVGCGMGLLEKHLEDVGRMVIGVDPAIYPKTRHLNRIYIQASLWYCIGSSPDIWLFCESLEHIPARQIWKWRRQASGFVVVTNDLWPIKTGYDHLTRLDDEFFDKFAEGATVLHRACGYLMMEL